MKRWIRVSAVVAGAVLGGTAAATALGTVVWGRATARTVERLAAGGSRHSAERFSPERLVGLPAPVVRYFRFALPPGHPPVRSARIEHAGEFRTGLDRPWVPFRSVQHVSTDPPGFVWDAKIHMVPLLGVRVRDSYVGGRGAMRARVGGVVPVVDQEGSPQLASGALHRYLAELAWIPTALLPGPGVAWEAVDDSTARVTLQDSGTAVSLEVHFGESGEIARVEAERYRDVDGVGVLTPFVGHHRRYAEVDGMRIPTEGEVEWILPEGRFPYWRGRIERIEYGYAR